ncbi:alpha-amlyase [Massilia arenosa]|uniref:Alpha-amlyase n=1 Tax=Zemynaea arenosa TaxID=2561931 RepID=A0A4Y9SB73_9BURK|nr:alpha-amylase family glycosyl hydrolase [Massilia arenosa]TFW19348.1 alpha-amlyase [Massilia arenosa]
MIHHRARRGVLAVLLGLAALAVTAHAANPYQPVPYVQFQHPEWSQDATIYQINTRQFTAEGSFRAAEKELPRLKKLGVGILWLMPIHPIGEKNRKGPLGSPYAVRDYRAVNPELGTLADLKHFVDRAHALGMHVILDWVGNHTSWDNVLRTTHPEWYDNDAKGQPRPTPWYDWDDIIDLDYSQPALRKYMTESMAYWVRDVGVDGYRVDAAGLVPQDFWDNASRELRVIKPVFMLAEWESRDMHAKAFDATYSWSWFDAMKNLAEGRADATSLHAYYAWNDKFYPREAYRLLGTSNHDKNSWEGTEFDIFGPATDSTIVFSFVSAGIPMLYNGQEAGNRKRLAFFERDPIVWQPSPYADLYRRLIALKKHNRALWNGAAGGRMEQVKNSDEKKIFSFVRAQGSQKVFAVFNFSAQPVHASFKDGPQIGTWRDFTTNATVRVDSATTFDLAPWSYKLFTQ